MFKSAVLLSSALLTVKGSMMVRTPRVVFPHVVKSWQKLQEPHFDFYVMNKDKYKLLITEKEAVSQDREAFEAATNKLPAKAWKTAAKFDIPTSNKSLIIWPTSQNFLDLPLDFESMPASKSTEAALPLPAESVMRYKAGDTLIHDLNLENFQVFFSELKGNAYIEEHSHNNDVYNLVVEGTFTIILDGKNVVVNPGHFVHIPKGAVHAVRTKEPVKIVEFWEGEVDE